MARCSSRLRRQRATDKSNANAANTTKKSIQQQRGGTWLQRPAPPLMRLTPELQRTRDFRDFEDFELIAFLDVVEVLHRHTAFEALAHFLDIVLEALERIEFARVDDDVVAQ